MGEGLQPTQLDKYKQQVADSSHHDEKLANSAMIEDRQLATRRVEMLESERDGLEEMLRDAMERSTGIDTGEVYTISPLMSRPCVDSAPRISLSHHFSRDAAAPTTLPFRSVFTSQLSPSPTHFVTTLAH